MAGFRAVAMETESDLGGRIYWTPEWQNVESGKRREPQMTLRHRQPSEWLSKLEANWRGMCFCFIDYAKAFDCVHHNKLWKILKQTGIPDHLTCLLRNLCAGQEATIRTGHRTIDWFQIRKGVRQGCILSSCLFNFYAEHIMQNARLNETQAGIKISGRNIITSDMQMTPTL